jgi:hypothetical protein
LIAQGIRRRQAGRLRLQERGERLRLIEPLIDRWRNEVDNDTRCSVQSSYDRSCNDLQRSEKGAGHQIKTSEKRSDSKDSEDEKIDQEEAKDNRCQYKEGHRLLSVRPHIEALAAQPVMLEVRIEAETRRRCVKVDFSCVALLCV